MSKRTAFVLHHALTAVLSQDKRDLRGSEQAVVMGRHPLFFCVTVHESSV